jgi:GTPase
MLIDQAKIYVKGGTGGSGCSSLFKDIFHRKGVPDGGDGGPGGDVVFTSDSNLHNLLDFRYNQHYKADSGKHGGSNKKFGKRGKDRIVRVPVGTILKDAQTDLVIRDLAMPGESVVVARGGAAGKGSAKLKMATKGEIGEEKTVILELKLVADVGIIGFPNAGKSTFVSSISKVKSKIAPYPFTTKDPKLGMVRFGDDSFIAADMPGLIEGAHAGRGLGDRFLKHIERTKVLVHLVEIAPLDGSSAVDNYYKLENELELYGAKVSEKPRIVVLSKMDLTDAEELSKDFKNKVDKDVFSISSVSGIGIDVLIKKIYGVIKYVATKSEEDND